MPCCTDFPEVAEGARDGAGDVREPGQIAVVENVGSDEEGNVDVRAEKGGEVGELGEAVGVDVVEGGGEREDGGVEGGDGGGCGVLHCGVLCWRAQNMRMREMVNGKYSRR